MASRGLNKVMIIGHLGRDPEMKYTANGKAVTTFSVAVDRTGALWIGIERGGVVRMRGGLFESIVPPSPPTATTAWTSSFAEDAAGALRGRQQSAKSLDDGRLARTVWAEEAKKFSFADLEADVVDGGE